MSASDRIVQALLREIRLRVEEISRYSRKVELPGAFGVRPFGAAPFGGGEVLDLPRIAPNSRIRINSAIYHIDRTERVLGAFFHGPLPNDDGEGWLRVYGALQAMFVQQEAAIVLLNTLGVAHGYRDRWTRFREIRNSSVGHPVERPALRSAFYPESTDSDSLAQITLRRVYLDGRPETAERIDLHALLEAHRQLLLDALGLTREELDRRVESMDAGDGNE